jgi:hypothetical protein
MRPCLSKGVGFGATPQGLVKTLPKASFFFCFLPRKIKGKKHCNKRREEKKRAYPYPVRLTANSLSLAG